MQVSAYGGKLKYTISYVPGPRGSPIEDADVQIIVSMMADVACMTHILRFVSINEMFEHYCSSIFPQGNDITLVARQTWRRGQGARESQDFEIDFREVRTHSHPFYFCFSSFFYHFHHIVICFELEGRYVVQHDDFFSVGTLAASRWHAGYPGTPDDGARGPR